MKINLSYSDRNVNRQCFKVFSLVHFLPSSLSDSIFWKLKHQATGLNTPLPWIKGNISQHCTWQRSSRIWKLPDQVIKPKPQCFPELNQPTCECTTNVLQNTAEVLSDGLFLMRFVHNNITEQLLTLYNNFYRVSYRISFSLGIFRGGWGLLLGYVWVCAVGDGGGAKLYPVSPGYWIVVDVFLPWMIILPVGKTKACCATSWHSALSSFPCHLLPSVTLCPRSSFSFQLPSFQPSLALRDWRCALTTQRDSVQSGWEESERSAQREAHYVSIWTLCKAARARLCLYQYGWKRGKQQEKVVGSVLASACWAHFSIINRVG